MKSIISSLFTMSLYTKNAHATVKGPLFLQDHEFLAELYAAYDKDYDDVVERYIGLYGSENCNLKELQLQASQMLQSLPAPMKENSDYFKVTLQLEQQLCEKIKAEYTNASIGSQQLLGEICNQSEIRQYKLKQRIKK